MRWGSLKAKQENCPPRFSTQSEAPVLSTPERDSRGEEQNCPPEKKSEGDARGIPTAPLPTPSKGIPGNKRSGSKNDREGKKMGRRKRRDGLTFSQKSWEEKMPSRWEELALPPLKGGKNSFWRFLRGGDVLMQRVAKDPST